MTGGEEYCRVMGARWWKMGARCWMLGAGSWK